MRIFHLHGDHFAELAEPPERAPPEGYLWLACERRELETDIDDLQARLQRWTGGQLVDLHVSDLLNPQLPSHFDITSWYDLLVFRRLALAPAPAPAAAQGQEKFDPSSTVRNLLEAIDTLPVGFALFDRLLLSVHPADCPVRDLFTHRLQQQSLHTDARSLARLPPGSADLMLRMVSHMVDGYLDLRRQMTRQLTDLQQALFNPRSRFVNWKVLLDSRNALHLLEAAREKSGLSSAIKNARHGCPSEKEITRCATVSFSAASRQGQIGAAYSLRGPRNPGLVNSRAQPAQPNNRTRPAILSPRSRPPGGACHRSTG